MKPRLLDWLCCAACKAPLALHAFVEVSEPGNPSVPDVEEGLLVCACGAAFPVIDGVPRMIEGALLAGETFRRRWLTRISVICDLGAALEPSTKRFQMEIQPTLERFGQEWGSHPLDQRTWGLDQATRLTQALRYLGWAETEARGRVVLDAGCGTGKLTCGMATWGGEVVGLDLAPGAVRGWRERRAYAGALSTRVHIVQGNLMQPPFRTASFDGVHSSGVLHHTPDTRAAFEAIAPLVKPGGSFGVWLYRSGGTRPRVPWLPFVHADWASVPGDVLRRWTVRLPPRLLFGLVLSYSAAFHVVYSAAARRRGKRHPQTVAERATSLFDSLAPPFVRRHSVEELAVWFKEAGFQDCRETTLPGDSIGVAMTGIRPPS